MNVNESELQQKKRALQFKIREERIRQNAVDREQRKQERINRLRREVESLAIEADRLGV